MGGQKEQSPSVNERHSGTHRDELKSNSKDSGTGAEANTERNVEIERDKTPREQCEDRPQPYVISKRASMGPECRFCGRHLESKSDCKTHEKNHD